MQYKFCININFSQYHNLKIDVKIIFQALNVLLKIATPNSSIKRKLLYLSTQCSLTSVAHLTFKKSETLQIFEIPYYENQSIREINNSSIIDHLLQIFGNKSITKFYYTFEFSSVQKLIEFKVTVEKWMHEYTQKWLFHGQKETAQRWRVERGSLARHIIKQESSLVPPSFFLFSPVVGWFRVRVELGESLFRAPRHLI